LSFQKFIIFTGKITADAYIQLLPAGRKKKADNGVEKIIVLRSQALLYRSSVA